MGLPLSVTVPQIKGIPWRYCSRWDEQPAAVLGKSLLRLGVCHMEDWSGSAVDFVERGFQRFCKQNGSSTAAQVWDGNLRIMDFLFDLNERDRHQLRGEMSEPTDVLFLVGEYASIAQVPIAAALNLLQTEDAWLPAAFFRVIVESLGTWMWAYDYGDAREHAEMCMEGVESEELVDSVYPKVERSIPTCLGDVATLTVVAAEEILHGMVPRLRTSTSRRLIHHLLEAHEISKGHDHAWPGKLTEHVPGLEDHLNDADGCVPGCVLNWYEGDEISACLDEQVSTFGQNGPLSPSILLAVRLNGPMEALDEAVRRVLDYAGAMVRSLASAAKLVQIIREIDDERQRKYRVEPGVQTEAGAVAVRGE